ncbi:MAG: hypothetical protein OXI64_12925 [Defluviicoccus sp.]|nr:hypothetical protein [Defluviicoccus sp.]
MDDRSRQLDLFGDRAPAAPESAPASRPVRLDTLSDDDILDLLPDAGMEDAVLLCGLVVERGLGDRALPALDRLWRRFRGFGHDRPQPEQEAVVETLARVGTAEARDMLRRIVTAVDLPPPLLPVGLRAALTAGLRLPRTFTGPLLRHADPHARELAARLSRFDRPDIAALEESIGDTHAPVRRAAAVALGRLGRASAKPVLLEELRRDPAGEIVAALSGIADDEDIPVHLGRCAEAHPALAETVAAALEEMETALSLKIARRIRAGQARRPD